MKKTILRIVVILIVLYLLKVAAWIWIIDQRETCYAEWHQWDETTYTCNTTVTTNPIEQPTYETITTWSIVTGITDQTTGSL